MTKAYYTVTTNNSFAALDDHSDEEAMIHAPPAVADAGSFNKQETEGRQGGRNNRSKNAGQANSFIGNQVASAAVTRGPRNAMGLKEGEEPEEEWPKNRGDRGAAKKKPVHQNNERMDRHSGTGRGREIKKDGGGAHNWGHAGDEFEAADAVKAEPAKEPGVPEGDAAAATPADQPPAKPEIKAYADYVEQNKNRESFLEQKAPVKKSAQLGSDVLVYNKKIEKSEPLVATAPSVATHAKNDNKHLINVQYSRQERRPGDNRRQQSDNKPAKGKTSPREKEQQREIKLDDVNVFPTLAH